MGDWTSGPGFGLGSTMINLETEDPRVKKEESHSKVCPESLDFFQRSLKSQASASTPLGLSLSEPWAR